MERIVVLKRRLAGTLGPERAPAYWQRIKDFVHARYSKEELEQWAKATLLPDEVGMHNEFISALIWASMQKDDQMLDAMGATEAQNRGRKRVSEGFVPDPLFAAKRARHLEDRRKRDVVRNLALELAGASRKALQTQGRSHVLGDARVQERLTAMAAPSGPAFPTPSAGAVFPTKQLSTHFAAARPHLFDEAPDPNMPHSSAMRDGLAERMFHTAHEHALVEGVSAEAVDCMQLAIETYMTTVLQAVYDHTPRGGPDNLIHLKDVESVMRLMPSLFGAQYLSSLT